LLWKYIFPAQIFILKPALLLPHSLLNSSKTLTSVKWIWIQCRQQFWKISVSKYLQAKRCKYNFYQKGNTLCTL